jgi:hypothetical protein
MTGKLNRENGSHELAMLSDSDIASNTQSHRASIDELRDADLTVVTGGWIPHFPGGGFPIGRIYKPVLVISTR